MKKQLSFSVLFILLLSLTYLGCSKDDDPVFYTLSVTITPDGAGAVSPSSGQFEEGEAITLTATPAQGYSFMNWTGDASGSSNPLQLTMIKDRNLTAVFAEVVLDMDGDGIPDEQDVCPDTPAGEVVHPNGCSASQTDMDNDGVNNDLDLCPNTPASEQVDEDGCAESQKDSDEDGVTDDLDECPESPPGSAVDEYGCPIGSIYTQIPDDDFEQILIERGYDRVLNDVVLTSVIDTITRIMIPFATDLNRFEIKDFKGIEGFADLEDLSLVYQNITGDALDLSQNSNLRTLSISCSFVDNLDLSQTTIETLEIGGLGIWFGTCVNRMSNLDLSGVQSLKALHISHVVFDDLNATLNSAHSIEEVTISSPLTDIGPLDYLDLSANSKLKTVALSAIFSRGPNIINLKNGANPQLLSLFLQLYNWTLDPDVSNWEPCIEADDPAYIESIVSAPFGALPAFSVTTDCGL